MSESNQQNRREDMGARKRMREVFVVEYRKPSDAEWHWWTTVMYRDLAEKIVRRMEGRYVMRIVEGVEES